MCVCMYPTKKNVERKRLYAIYSLCNKVYNNKMDKIEKLTLLFIVELSYDVVLNGVLRIVKLFSCFFFVLKNLHNNA
jgi:hypothetical protein